MRIAIYKRSYLDPVMDVRKLVGRYKIKYAKKYRIRGFSDSMLPSEIGHVSWSRGGIIEMLDWAPDKVWASDADLRHPELDEETISDVLALPRLHTARQLQKRATKFSRKTQKTTYTPYGMRLKDGKYVAGSRAKVVRMVFQLYLEVLACNKVKEIMNLGTVPAPGGGKWNSYTINRILRREAYRGTIVSMQSWDNVQVILNKRKRS